jgi:hypothetical protein
MEELEMAKQNSKSRSLEAGRRPPVAIATARSTAALTHDQLRRFAGDLVRFRHALNRRVIYTPGVQFLAEQGGAYWLIDVIASYLTPAFIEKAAQADSRVAEMHFWRLDVAADASALVTAQADAGCPPFVSQQIPCTNFPLEFVSVWAAFDGEHWTLYLPSEH